ncbi:MAG: gliding motility-associated C-terminal domain-containing protein [Fulvivirga sp.]
MPKAIFRSVLFFLVGLTSFAQSQNRDIFWHFGSNANSIEFTKPDMTPQLINLPNNLGTGGGAVASDYLNGALLFYTDGVDVYAADDTQLVSLIGSTTRNQSAVVTLNPADADTSEYFIFHVDNAGQIRSTVYDKNLFRNNAFPLPPDGDIDPARTNVIDPNLPATVLSEGMIAIANDQQNGFWLITHEQGTTNYNVTQIDGAGINTTVIPIAGAPTDVASFSYSSANNQIAVSPSNAVEDIAILNIDLATGALTNSGIDLSTVTTAGIYDTEWSSTGEFLYISGNFGNPNDELKRVNVTETPIADSTIFTNGIVNSFGLQYGADTTIYHLYENAAGEFLVGRIEDPNNDDVNQTLYNPLVFPNNVDFQGQQFPAFLPPYQFFIEADFVVSGGCTNTPTYFFPQVAPDIGTIVWDFLEDGNFIPLIGGSFTYTTAGTYNVTMRVTVGGSVQTVTKPITITDFDLTLQIDPQQQYWCPEDFPVQYTATASGANASGATIRWSNQTAAEANATTTFDVPGTYYVVATDPNTGCEVYQEQQVFEYGVQNSFAFVWYFGNNAGLDFNPLFDTQNPGPIQPVNFGDPDYNGGNNLTTLEGCAIYCDANGDPLLYSDGMEVYNKAGDQLTTDLGGNNNATQSIFIVENPSDATQYFLFFTNEVPNTTGATQYNFSYALFDLKMLDGDGDLVRDGGGNPIITTLFNNSTERITGNANWVIVHEYGNDIFRAYPLVAQGIGAPVFSNVGQIHTATATSARGYMRLSGDKLAVALSISPTENYVDYFNFDVGSGAITHVLTLDTEETGQVYGVEFSPSTNNLYASIIGPDNKIIGWEVDTTTLTGTTTDTQYIIDSKTEVFSDGTVTFGALQQGPLGSVYVAKEGATTLGSINNPDDITAPDFVMTTGDFPNVGAGGTSELGLPNFVDRNGSNTPSPSLAVLNGCQGDPLTFTVLNPLPDPQIEWYAIAIFDSSGNQIVTSDTLSSGDPNWIFNSTQNPGSYEAQLFILNDCNPQQFPTTNQSPLPFVINPNPTIGPITVVQPPSVCGANDAIVDIEFTANSTQTYSIAGPVAVPTTTVNGPATETINNLSAGFYTLTVTEAFTSGTCSSTFNFTINDPVPYTLVGSELSAADCNDENGEAQFQLTGPMQPATYTWQLRTVSPDVLVGSGDQTSSTVSGLASGDYYFRLIDNAGCTSSDTLTITLPPDHTLTIDTIDPSCDQEPIVFNITTDTNQPVTVNEFVNGTVGNEIPNYTIVGNNDSIRIDHPGGGDQSLEYVVVAPGDIDGPCTVAELITVSFGSSDPSPYVRAATYCGFEQAEEKNSVFLDNNPSGFTSVRWFDSNGDEILASNNDPDYVFENDTLKVRTNGRITAELTNVFGCVTTTEINIIEDCKPRVNAPTAFRPNSAISANQTWTIFPFLVANDEFELFIYNRWGELVFQSSDLNFMVNEGWNGGYDNDPGRPVQGGAYAFKVQFKSSFEQETAELQERRGGITLIR